MALRAEREGQAGGGDAPNPGGGGLPAPAAGGGRGGGLGMKRRALAVTAAFLVVLLLAPPRGLADDLPTEGKLTISGYDADAMRSDDPRSLAAAESYFYNNSGSQPFSGNITIWVSRGAHIATGLCGSVTNRVVRLESTKIACYDLETVAEGVFKIRPFEAGEFGSHSRQGPALPPHLP